MSATPETSNVHYQMSAILTALAKFDAYRKKSRWMSLG